LEKLLLLELACDPFAWFDLPAEAGDTLAEAVWSGVRQLVLMFQTLSDLAIIAPLANLHTLLFFDTRVTDDGLAHLAKLPLKTLNLFSTKVTDAGLLHLAKPPLQTLDLTNTQVSDAGLEHLSKLPLHTLYLTNTQVSNAGLEGLSKLPLQTLYLYNT